MYSYVLPDCYIALPSVLKDIITLAKRKKGAILYRTSSLDITPAHLNNPILLYCYRLTTATKLEEYRIADADRSESEK